MRFFQWLWALFTRAEQPKPERVVTKERGEFLSDDERKMCGDETCPDCGTVDKFIGGPTAGLAANKRHTIELCLETCKKVEEEFAARTSPRETTPAHWERNGAQRCIDAIKDLADEVATSPVVDAACPPATCADCEVLRRQVGIAQAIADEKHGKLEAAQEQLLRIDRANEERGNTPKST